MGASKDTPNLRLPIYEPGDKYSILGDQNDAMSKIDTAIYTQDQKNLATNNIATTAMTMVGEAKSTADAAKTASDAATAASTTATSTANTARTTANAATTTANTAASDASAARSDASAARNSASLALTASQNAVQSYKRDTVAVFVGTSNVVPGTWPEDLSNSMGWTCKNYAVSGMGYTFGGSNSFEGQLNRAKNDSSIVNSQVGFVFICDAANDARSKNEIYDSAVVVFTLARATFPNARIICLPALWSTDLVDRGVDTLFWFARTITNLRAAASAYRIEWIDGSWSWHQDSQSMYAETVHYNASGYGRVRRMVEQYLLGSSSTWINSEWRDVTFNGSYTGPQTGNTQPLRAKRTMNSVNLSGSFKPPTTGIAVQDVPAQLPKGVWPTQDITVVGYSGNDPLNVTIMSNGQVKMWTAKAGQTLVNISANYDTF